MGVARVLRSGAAQPASAVASDAVLASAAFFIALSFRNGFDTVSSWVDG
jgi:hypothetical protein